MLSKKCTYPYHSSVLYTYKKLKKILSVNIFCSVPSFTDIKMNKSGFFSFFSFNDPQILIINLFKTLIYYVSGQ